MSADETLRKMLADNIGQIRESLSRAQAEMLKLGQPDLDAIDDTDELARLVDLSSSLVKSAWPIHVSLLLIVADSIAKKGAE